MNGPGLLLDIQKINVHDFKRQLNSHISGERFEHSVEVSKEAASLAKHYGVMPKKAEIAGLLHDCSRGLSYEALLQQALENNYIPDKIEEENPKLLHAFVSSILVKNEYGIDDEEILSAIRNHTTGNEQMSLMDTIVYVADFIEPTRNYDQKKIDKIKTVALSNIKKAALIVVNETLDYLRKNELVVHPRTLLYQYQLIQETKFK